MLWLQPKRAISKTPPPNNEACIKITGKNYKPCHWGSRKAEQNFRLWHLRALQINLSRGITSAGQNSVPAVLPRREMSWTAQQMGTMKSCSNLTLGTAPSPTARLNPEEQGSPSQMPRAITWELQNSSTIRNTDNPTTASKSNVNSNAHRKACLGTEKLPQFSKPTAESCSSEPAPPANSRPQSSSKEKHHLRLKLVLAF